MNYDDLRTGQADDMSETKLFVRCDVCGRMVVEGTQLGWRVLLTDSGDPIWGCAQDFERNPIETENRMQMIYAARSYKTPALSPDEWLAIFGD